MERSDSPLELPTANCLGAERLFPGSLDIGRHRRHRLLRRHRAVDLAGRWQGEDRGHGGRSIPVVLELSVDNTTASGTVKDGGAPARPIANGRVANGTLTFTTSVLLNGNEIVLTWEGTLDGDRLPLVRKLPNGTALPPLDMRRN